MHSSRFSFFSAHALFGLIVLLFGIAFLLDNLDVMRAGEILRYWPAALILFGAVKILEPGSTGAKVFGWIVLFLGVVLLLDNLDIVYVHIWDLWPLLLVLMGAAMIWRVVRGTPFRTSEGGTESYLSGTAVLGGWKRSVASADLKGGQLTALLGGCELDLRGSTIRGEEAVIDLFAFWGGVEMFVPPQWRVVIQVTPILGGIDDKTKPPDDPEAKRLVVRGTVIMGGADIKN